MRHKCSSFLSSHPHSPATQQMHLKTNNSAPLGSFFFFSPSTKELLSHRTLTSRDQNPTSIGKNQHAQGSITSTGCIHLYYRSSWRCLPRWGPTVLQVVRTRRSSICFHEKPEAGTLWLRANKYLDASIFTNTLFRYRSAQSVLTSEILKHIEMNCGIRKSGTEKGNNLKQPGTAVNLIHFGDILVSQARLPGLPASQGVVAQAQFWAAEILALSVIALY